VLVDTSALIAVVRREVGYEVLREALILEPALVPTPVLVEFARVTALAGNRASEQADAVVQRLLDREMRVEVFTADDARIAAKANAAWGTGNGRGGPLNMLDLMVYAVAMRTGRPILCTGRDFAATDAAIHPASRLA